MSQAIVAVLWMDAESVVKGAKKNSLVGLSPFACPISWTILLGNRNDDDGDMCAGRLTQPCDIFSFMYSSIVFQSPCYVRYFSGQCGSAMFIPQIGSSAGNTVGTDVTIAHYILRGIIRTCV